MSIKRILISFVLSLGLLLALSLVLTLSRAPAPTLARPLSDTHIPAGTITTDTTWTSANSPYILDGSVTVAPGVTLTVEPGVTVMAGINVELKVQGHLEALGTSAQPITFTHVPGDYPWWTGLIFDGSAGQGTGHLRQVTVEYGANGSSVGYNPFDVLALNVLNGQVLIEDSRIQNNYRGLYIVNSHVVVSGTLFRDSNSDHDPIEVDGAGSVMTLTGNLFMNNEGNRVLLHPGAMTGHNFALTPQATLQGYELTGNFVVPAGITLTVEPGVTVLSQGGAELTVQGHLQAVGTPTQPITFTSQADTGRDQWVGLAFDGGTGLLRYATLRYAGNYAHGGDPLSGYEAWQIPCGVALTARNVLTGELRIEHTQFVMNGLEYWWRADAVMRFYNSHVTVQDSYISDNGSPATKYDALPEPNYVIFAYGPLTELTLSHNTFDQNRGPLFCDGGQFTLDGNLIRHQTKGVLARPNLGLLLLNNVLADLGGDALQVVANGQVTALHTTLARNNGNAVYVKAGGTAALTNTILSENTTGVRVDSGGSLSLARTLWDGNTANTSGAVNATGNLTGSAAFADDGYHLTRNSLAINQGVDAGVPDDLDEQPRPMPLDAPPDLGADEYPYSPSPKFLAEKVALPPQALPPDSSRGILHWRLRQPYLIRYAYGSPDPNPPDVALAITDTWPTELALESQASYPSLSFQQQGNTLKWNSPTLHAGQSGTIQLIGVYTTPQPGRVLTNQAELQAGAHHFNLEAQTTTPFFPPLITSIDDGEYCYLNNVVNVSGMALDGALIRVYENGLEVITTTADAQGLFTSTYQSLHAMEPITVTARACLISNPAACSAESAPVHLIPANSFWDPQRSYWEGTPTTGPLAGHHLTYNFRNSNGNFSTQNWQIPGVFGFWNTHLHLYVCDAPQNVTVTADGTDYPPTSISENWYWFDITFAHQVTFHTIDQVDHGDFLIDPDGYVFDVTKGFDPLTPTLHTVQGVTVTAYVSLPQWGGWVPWPAQLYNDQQNPQVTGPDGYFAFFTPPGLYYLQVDGANGYQSWRSPIVQVITQVVHVNVPLTPWANNNIAQVTLTADGPMPQVITVPVGSTIEWLSDLNSTASLEELPSWFENPMLRPLSSRDPLSDTLGFDGGMLTPSQVYRRQFTAPGTYAYTDSLGHSGQVVITQSRFYIYLPLVLRH